MRRQNNRTIVNPQRGFVQLSVGRGWRSTRDRLDYRVTHAHFADGIQSARDFAK